MKVLIHVSREAERTFNTWTVRVTTDVNFELTQFLLITMAYFENPYNESEACFFLLKIPRVRMQQILRKIFFTFQLATNPPARKIFFSGAGIPKTLIEILPSNWYQISKKNVTTNMKTFQIKFYVEFAFTKFFLLNWNRTPLFVSVILL